MLRNIAGRELDGSCYNLTIGKTIIPFTSFSYSDNVETEWVYSSGSQLPDAQTPGQYKPGDGKLKVRGVTARALIIPNLPQFGAANARTVAVCNYVHPDLGSDSDALIDFRILGASMSAEATSKAQEIEFTCKYRLIQWTSKRIVFGNERGGGPRGAFRL